MAPMYRSMATRGLGPLCALTLVLAACGGGGGGNSSGGPVVPTAGRTSTPTRTRTLAPGVPTETATPSPVPDTPTPTSTPILAGSNILDAIHSAGPGAVILVAEGTYEPLTLQGSDVNGPITLVSDRSNIRTGATGATARIDAGGGTAAITLQGVADLVIDGFVASGGSLAGIRIIDSVGITIKNSVVRTNARDGIRLERSSSAVFFDNLLFDNGGAGISVVGGDDVRIINNTIYGSGESGLIVGDSLLPSSNLFVRNNIFDGNALRGISVHPSTTGFDSNYNLNRDGYSRADLRGSHDTTGDPFFNQPGTDNGFHLPPTDENCDGGSAATDSGDPDTDPGLELELEERTTQTDERFDCIGDFCCPVDCGDTTPCTRQGFPDMGFHYISALAVTFNTPTPRPTRTPTEVIAPTATESPTTP